MVQVKSLFDVLAHFHARLICASDAERLRWQSEFSDQPFQIDSNDEAARQRTEKMLAKMTGQARAIDSKHFFKNFRRKNKKNF